MAEEAELVALLVHPGGLAVHYDTGAAFRWAAEAGPDRKAPTFAPTSMCGWSMDWSDDADPRALLVKVAKRIAKEARRATSVCIASAGPLKCLDLRARDAESPDYGTLTKNTMHQRMRGLDVYWAVKEGLNAGGLTTSNVFVCHDCSAGALGEAYRRYATETEFRTKSVVYVYVGEGIGGGLVAGGHRWAGGLHTEMGYIPARVARKDPWHDKLVPTVELDHHNVFIQDVASSSSMEERWRKPLEDLHKQRTHDAWRLEAHYLAQLCSSITAMLAPHQIVLDGPVMFSSWKEETPRLNEHMLGLIRDEYPKWLMRHGSPILRYPENDLEKNKSFIDVPSGREAFLFGAVCAAAEAAGLTRPKSARPVLISKTGP